MQTVETGGVRHVEHWICHRSMALLVLTIIASPALGESPFHDFRMRVKRFARNGAAFGSSDESLATLATSTDCRNFSSHANRQAIVSCGARSAATSRPVQGVRSLP